MTELLHFIQDKTKTPKKQRQGMSSLVCVIGEENNYTESEIALLEQFSKAYIEWDNRIGPDKTFAYYIFFQKGDDGRWLRVKESWTEGPLYSPTLKEALVFMYDNYGMDIPPSLHAYAKPKRRFPPAVIRLKEHPNA
jgi:hypothetical protein